MDLNELLQWMVLGWLFLSVKSIASSANATVRTLHRRLKTVEVKTRG